MLDLLKELSQVSFLLHGHGSAVLPEATWIQAVLSTAAVAVLAALLRRGLFASNAEQLREAGEALQREMLAREEAERALRALQGELEVRMAERTAELVRINEDLRREVAEREQAQQALREMERRLSTLAASNVIGIIVGQEDTVMEANDEFLRILGLTRAGFEQEGLRWPAITVPGYEEADRRANEECRATGRCQPYEKEYRRRDGTYVPVLLAAIVLEQEPFRWMGLVLDITARKHAEEALRASEARYRAIVDTAHDGVWLIDTEARTIYANDRLGEMLGCTVEEIRRRTVLDFIFPEDRPLAQERIGSNFLGRAEQFDFRFRRVDGSAVLVLAATSAMTDGQGHIVGALGMFSDITERKKGEEALRESEERYRLAARATNDAIRDWNLEADVLGWSPAVADLFGWEEALSGTTLDWWKRRIHPADRVRVLSSLFAALQGETEHWTEEYRFRRANGSYADVFDRGYVLRGLDGRPHRMVGAMFDLSERKRAEQALRESERQLRRLNASLEARVEARTQELRQAVEQLEWTNRELQVRNRELQEFAYVASHDLKEPLRKIQTFIGLTLSDYGEQVDETGRMYLERTQHAAQRLMTLIDDLLAFSRVATQSQPFRKVDLGQVAREVVQDLEVRLGETAGQVEVGILPVIEADATQMRQLLQNLIGNALKFHRDGVPPRVRLEAAVEEVAPVQGPAARVVRLAVQDNGIGFDPKYVDRIFAPFQRLHGRSAYEGTGMGLAICRRIVERHGGAITAESTPGEGSTFLVTLPLAHAAASSAPTSSEGPAPVSRSSA